MEAKSTEQENKHMACKEEIDRLQMCLNEKQQKFDSMAKTFKETRVFRLSYEYINEDREKTRFWTGFQSTRKFHAFLDAIEDYGISFRPGRNTVTFRNAVVMWFARVRHNLDLGVVSHLFGLRCTQTVSNILNDMNAVLLGYFRHPPNAPKNLFTKEIVDKLRLPCFQEKYPTTALIIDCTEFFIQTPSNLDFQANTYSAYKHHNTMKMLVGMSAAGHCVYVSPLYPGRLSDREISEICKEDLYDMMWVGSSAMGDKGFHIEDLLPDGCTYNMPPMLRRDDQFSERQNNETIKIASSRIHIERVNARAKLFKMLAQEVRIVDIHFFTMAAEICFFLTDIISPIVRRDAVLV